MNDILVQYRTVLYGTIYNDYHQLVLEYIYIRVHLCWRWDWVWGRWAAMRVIDTRQIRTSK